jgi:predicted helicase
MLFIETYLDDLKNTSIDEITEHSHRKSLQVLLESIGKQSNPQSKIIHEPKAQGRFGRPDFLVKETENIIGFVENKKLGEDLSEILKTDQIKKYTQLSDNILLTNYLDWVWIRNGKAQLSASLGKKIDLLNKKFRPKPDDAIEVQGLIQHFFETKSLGIGTPKDLAKALAVRGAMLRDELTIELQRQENEDQRGKLFGLFSTFQQTVSNELSLPEFADAFSQMLVYGLFLAKLNADTQPVHLFDAKRFVPDSFALIQELVSFLDELERPNYANTKWIIEEVLTILNSMDMAEIQNALNWSKNHSKDPFIYFYEDFLGQYDAKLRKAKGVYYTPPAVVNFIIRAVNGILKDTFEMPDGLADRHKVRVLDFATGTGTFLLEVMQQILENTSPIKHDLIIKEHLLKNLYGFEYMIASYTIAHLKLSQFMKENGYHFSDKDRVQIYLTNTLENKPYIQSNLMLPALNEEGKKAQTIKEKQPILIITGNPPYSGHSKNNSDWIKQRIKDYFWVDGKPLGEKNPKWLQDDYVKFFRFAQYKIEQVQEGIVAIITNHSFLDNPTFRGMRQSLMLTFDQLYFLDLHGNAKKKETSPDGSKDENVFDIEQGVAISILIKKKGVEKGVFVADFYGKREQKYQTCLETEFRKTDWKKINPSPPFYLFQEQNQTLKPIYDKFWSVNEIFKVSGVGIVTGRDELTVHYTKEKLQDTINDFAKLPENEAREKYKLGSDSRDWQVKLAQNELIKTGLSPNNIQKISYRPFDIRFTYFTGKSKGFQCMPRGEVMKHMLSENVGLVARRQQLAGKECNYYFVSQSMIADGLIRSDNKGSESLFPLYLYESQSDGGLFASQEPSKVENFTKEFKEFINQQYSSPSGAEGLMGYIYAILHSPSYRSKYADFLKIDFPRIPFTADAEVFAELSKLGYELIEHHLLKKVPPTKIGSIAGAKIFRVEKPSWQNERLYFNTETYFSAVPKAVYEFQIGGYQVLDKYLKDRKGRELSIDEIENIEKVIKVLQFTIEQMQKINELTEQWI